MEDFNLEIEFINKGEYNELYISHDKQHKIKSYVKSQEDILRCIKNYIECEIKGKGND